jgi:hypothetical protein
MTLQNVSTTVSKWFDQTVQSAGLWEHVDYIRETLSDSKNIHALVALYEFAWLCNELIPVKHYNVPIPYIQDNRYNNLLIRLPEIFVLLEWTLFWRPIVYWFIIGVSSPLLVSNFVIPYQQWYRMKLSWLLPARSRRTKRRKTPPKRASNFRTGISASIGISLSTQSAASPYTAFLSFT